MGRPETLFGELLEGFDLPLVLGSELLELLLLFQGEHWLFIGILGGLPPPAHLLGEHPPLVAVGAELGGVKPCRLQHNRELVGSAACNRQALLQ